MIFVQVEVSGSRILQDDKFHKIFEALYFVLLMIHNIVLGCSSCYEVVLQEFRNDCTFQLMSTCILSWAQYAR